MKPMHTADTTTPVSMPMPMPSDKALQAATRLAIDEDRPIMMDYWKPSLPSTLFPGRMPDDECARIGVKEDKTKMLFKNPTEYTSNISRICKADNTYIIMTENSIYLVSAEITAHKLSGSH